MTADPTEAIYHAVASHNYVAETEGDRTRAACWCSWRARHAWSREEADQPIDRVREDHHVHLTAEILAALRSEGLLR